MVSDSVGETAEFVVKAVATQFNGGNVDIRRHCFAEDKKILKKLLGWQRIVIQSLLIRCYSRVKEIFGSIGQSKKELWLLILCNPLMKPL